MSVWKVISCLLPRTCVMEALTILSILIGAWRTLIILLVVFYLYANIFNNMYILCTYQKLKINLYW